MNRFNLYQESVLERNTCGCEVVSSLAGTFWRYCQGHQIKAAPVAEEGGERMTVVEAMENALEMLKHRGIMGGDVYDDLLAAINLTRKQYPRTLGGELPERKED